MPLDSEINVPILEKDEELTELKFELEETVEELDEVQKTLDATSAKLVKLQEEDSAWFPVEKPREIWQWILAGFNTLFWVAFYKLFRFYLYYLLLYYYILYYIIYII